MTMLALHRANRDYAIWQARMRLAAHRQARLAGADMLALVTRQALIRDSLRDAAEGAAWCRALAGDAA